MASITFKFLDNMDHNTLDRIRREIAINLKRSNLPLILSYTDYNDVKMTQSDPIPSQSDSTSGAT
jgi:hypothetical protein